MTRESVCHGRDLTGRVQVDWTVTLHWWITSEETRGRALWLRGYRVWTVSSFRVTGVHRPTEPVTGREIHEEW